MAKSEFGKHLEKYMDLLEEIRIEERRKKSLPANGDIIQRRAAAGICDELRVLLEKEDQQYEFLTSIINQLPRAIERQIMMARYMDGQSWNQITEMVYGEQPDFKEKAQNYLRYVLRAHGEALRRGSRILQKQ